MVAAKMCCFGMTKAFLEFSKVVNNCYDLNAKIQFILNPVFVYNCCGIQFLLGIQFFRSNERFYFNNLPRCCERPRERESEKAQQLNK